jgi:FkbM family methyltransferase
MNFKSQLGQDEWVCKIFDYKKNGYFIDIGAFNGIDFSNTYCLEKELDWQGVCVEAAKNSFNSLIKNRKCLCLNKAIYNENKMVLFNENGMFGMIKEDGDQAIEAITIDKLLEICNAPNLIDYISLDIEGSEYEALEKFPFDKYKVIAWTIEHNSHLDSSVLKEKVRKIMIDNKYSLVPENQKAITWEDWFYDSEFIKI